MRQWAVVGASLVLLAALLVIGLRLRPEPEELAHTASPVLASVTLDEESLRRNAVLVAELAEPVTVLAAGAEGRVLSVEVAPGDIVSTGTVLAVVDGVSILVVHTPRPFWRPLRSGSKGDDVAMLQCVLADLGHYEGPCDGSFGSATARAVTAFNESVGRGHTAVFHPSAVLWLPQPSLAVGELAIEAGAWFPAPGQVVVRASPQLVAVRVTDARLTDLDIERFGPLRFRPETTGVVLAVADDLTVRVEDLNPELVALLQSPPGARSPGGDASEAGPGGVAGTLTGTNSFKRLAVPSMAIVETPEEMCVYPGDDRDGPSVAVTPVGSSASGAVFVEGDLAPGQQVVANPRALGLVGC